MAANPIAIDDAPFEAHAEQTVPEKAQASQRAVLLVQTLILAFLFAVPAIRAFHHPCVTDPDIWWHLSIGNFVLQHHAVPHVDFMTRSVAGLPWQAYSWLFDSLVATLFYKFGIAGIVLYTATMLLAIAVALYRLASRRLDFSLAVGLTFVVGFSIMPLETPRSWLFSILFFVLELGILMHVRETGKTRELFWVPVILALWANLHIQFVHGLILLSLAFGESVATRWFRDKKVKSSPLALGGTLLATVAATLCNPYGWHVYKVAYGFGTKTDVLNKISEVQSMAFRDASNFAILALAFAAVVVLAKQSRPMLFEKALFVFAALISFHSKRDVWMVAVVACAILGSFAVRKSTDSARLPKLALTCAAALALLGCAVSLPFFKLRESRLVEDQKTGLPVAATDFVVAHHLQGPLYNDFNWGGYLYWKLHMPVSMDGRVAPFGDERIDRSLRTWGGAPDWAGDAMLQNANLVIGAVDYPLVQLLRVDPRYQLVYEDKLAAVFTRR